MSRAGFVAIVLAGDRRMDDPLVEASGKGCKALLPIAGSPMILHVLGALDASPSIATVHLSGPPATALRSEPALLTRLDSGAMYWRESSGTPSTSASDPSRRTRTPTAGAVERARHRRSRSNSLAPAGWIPKYGSAGQRWRPSKTLIRFF